VVLAGAEWTARRSQAVAVADSEAVCQPRNLT
jgi:hypothetical protein